MFRWAAALKATSGTLAHGMIETTSATSTEPFRSMHGQPALWCTSGIMYSLMHPPLCMHAHAAAGAVRALVPYLRYHLVDPVSTIAQQGIPDRLHL